MTGDEPGFTVTLRDVWEAQQETNRQVASLVEQLPAHVTATAEDITELRALIKDHESRVRVLEARIWRIFGGFSALVLASSVVEIFYYATHH